MDLKVLHHLAFTDQLTGLGNRHALSLATGSLKLSRIPSQYQYISTSKTNLSVLIDLRGFKKINDTYGQTVGDKCLYSYAKKLKKLVDKFDNPGKRNTFVGRIGGDEFLIFLSFDHRGSDERAKKITSILTQLAKLKYRYNKKSVVTCRFVTELSTEPINAKTWPKIYKKLSLRLSSSKKREKSNNPTRKY